jgi:ABC-type uncharacterized transport system substrate-binding protein
MSSLTRLLAISALLGMAAIPAAAHPHVWVTVKSELRWQDDGRVAGVRHAWTFDEGYSAYVTQGLDTNRDGKLTPDELLELAKENTTSLVDFDYFTIIKANGRTQAFGDPTDYGMAFDKGTATLSFYLPLRAPVRADKSLSLEVYDPTFFVEFRLADGEDAVATTGAPKGCVTTVTRPKAIDPVQQQKLGEAFFEALSSSSNFGAQFANRAIIACP